MIQVRQKRLRHYTSFSPSICSYADRAEPGERCDAIGRVVCCRAELRTKISDAVASLSESPRKQGRPEMSFEGTLEFLGNLVQRRAGENVFNVGLIPAAELYSELAYVCAQADRLATDLIDGKFGEMDSGKILDVADFACATAMDVEEFFVAP